MSGDNNLGCFFIGIIILDALFGGKRNEQLREEKKQRAQSRADEENHRRETIHSSYAGELGRLATQIDARMRAENSKDFIYRQVSVSRWDAFAISFSNSGRRNQVYGELDANPTEGIAKLNHEEAQYLLRTLREILETDRLFAPRT
jgi:hypothetical protein